MKIKSFLLYALITFLTLNAEARQSQHNPTQLGDDELKGVIIKLERTECFGACPVYSITIHGDGVVDYDGKKFVKETGKRSYKISRENVRELVEEFYKADYFSMEKEYLSRKNADGTETQVTDLPATQTSITIGKKTKSVYNYFGGPDALRELEHKIDQISGVAKYVKKK
ncbi:MAG: DUF6438 domain-containing protein [Pyrinomonadaceae bacterium]